MFTLFSVHRRTRARRLTPEEKTPYMEEWWSKSHDLLMRGGVHESTLRHIVQLGGLSLRENGAVLRDPNPDSHSHSDYGSHLLITS